MNQRDLYPDALAWLPDGHVSDWVLNALVDGEATLLSDEVVSHVDACEHCTERLATMATMAFALGEELSFLVEQRASKKTPFPLAFFGAAFLFTAGAVLFSWNARGRALGELPHELLTFSRGLRLVGPLAAQQLGVGLLVVSASVVVVTAIAGAILARRHSFTRSPESPS